MRFLHPNGYGSLRSGHAAWCLVFVLLSLSVARHGADPTEIENALPTEHPETLPEGADAPGGHSWGWSAGGWLSIGDWSSSWRSMVSGTRSAFRWRFGNVQHEEGDEGAEEAGGVTEGSPGGEGLPRCEGLTLDMCRGLGYDATSMPNLLNHESQDIARVELEQYSPLVQANCSRDMAFFLCALHAPRCSEEGGGWQGALLPCRPLCERIKARCDVVMERFQFTWPTIFECEKYPDPLQAHCAGQ